MTEQDRTRWNEIEDIFQRVCNANPADRDDLLDSLSRGNAGLRAEVDSLLRSRDQVGDFLESSVHDAVSGPDAHLGSVVGAFRLEELIGTGGMGAVYRARRIDGVYEQEVAVKLIRDTLADPELVRRFGYERQVLATLRHPHIARLIDGGVTDDGRPYLAMEFVRGRPITKYCDENRLDLGQRLDLFDSVCAAVQHAHNSLIVHRDLKPAHILIDDDGQPRLLDFGIAAALDETGTRADVTVTQQRRFTPQYASPEQVRGLPITTGTDVYSLGVILYELLSGRRPYRVTGHTPADDTRAICETTPPTPSRRLDTPPEEDEPATKEIAAARRLDPARLRRRLKGDLETIVMTALRKEPQRRYRSAEALREDLRRYRQSMPISARPDSFSYRTSTFLRRNRLPVAAGVAVFLALVAGVIGTGWQAREASRGQAAAEAALATSDTVGRFLRSILLAADPREGGKDITMRGAIDRAADRIEAELGESPAVEARVREAIGTTYRTLGAHAEAQVHLERSLELAQTSFGERDLVTARIAHELGILRIDQGRFEEALAMFDLIVSVREEMLGPRDPVTLRTRNDRGIIFEHLDRYDHAYAELAAVAKAREEVLGATHPDTLETKNNLSSVLRFLDRNDEAVALAEEVYDAQVMTIGADHPDTLISANDIGVILKGMDRFEEAMVWLERAAEGLESHFPAGSLDVIIPRINLADTLGQLGRFDEAIDLGLATIADAEPTLGIDHYIVAIVRTDLARHYLAVDDVPRAIAQARPARDALSAALGPEHRYTIEAEETLQRALERADGSPPPEPSGGSSGG